MGKNISEGCRSTRKIQRLTMAYVKMKCEMTDCFGYNTETERPFCEVLENPCETSCPFYREKTEYYAELKRLDGATGKGIAPSVKELHDWVIKAERFSPYCSGNEEALHTIQKFIMEGGE